MPSAEIPVVVGQKWAIFMSLSTQTPITLYPCEGGSLTMKSIETDCQGPPGIRSGCSQQSAVAAVAGSLMPGASVARSYVFVDKLPHPGCHECICATLLTTQAPGTGSTLWGHNPGPKSTIHSLRTSTCPHAI